MKKHMKVLVAAAAMALAGQASAQTTWTLATSGAVPGVGTSSSITATSAGWANTSYSSGGANNYKLEIQPLTLYSGGGLGIDNLDETESPPEHAIDNQDRFEMVLIRFSAPVNLTGLTIGYPDNQMCGSSFCDSDMTVMAYTEKAGSMTTPSNLSGKTWASLISSGWEVIANPQNVIDNTLTSWNTTASSSYWLIGAANTLVGGIGLTCTSGTSCSCGTTCDWDYVKLLSVFAPGPSGGGGVPEPGSLALFGMALFGIVSAARRRKA